MQSIDVNNLPVENFNFVGILSVLFDNQVRTIMSDRSLKSSVGWVVLEHVNHIIDIDEWIVNGNNLNGILLDGGTEDESSDSSESINSNCWFSHNEKYVLSEGKRNVKKVNLSLKKRQRKRRVTIKIFHINIYRYLTKKLSSTISSSMYKNYIISL